MAATWYPDQATHLKVWYQNQPYQFWSNLNWHHLEGITGLEDQGQKFHFMLFLHAPHREIARYLNDPGREGTTKAPKNEEDGKEVKLPQLPLLAKDGPFSTATLETSQAEHKPPAPVLNFLEAAHQLYLTQEKVLLAATEKRTANREEFRQRQAEAARNAPQAPTEIVVRYWLNEPKPLPAHLQPKGRKETK